MTCIDDAVTWLHHKIRVVDFRGSEGYLGLGFLSCLGFGLFGMAWGCEVVRALGSKAPGFLALLRCA